MSRTRNVIFTLLLTGGALLFVAPLHSAMAQEQGTKGIFGGLFNKDNGSSGAKPLRVVPKTGTQTTTGSTSTGGASATGVAKPSPYASGSTASLNYRNVTESDMDKMTMSEIIQMETDKQTETTEAYRVEKVRESQEMAEMYRAQMQERLASQMNDPSALQSMGAGGTGGVSEEQIKRKMVYKPKDGTTTGKKPIRLFDVR